MKSKKRHHSSEDESEDSDASDRSSSSESESEESSASEQRHRKKKKRADSSDSDSDSDDRRRSKKRKHKKKKKKHVKRRRHSESADDSRSDADNGSSESEGELSKKKHKKHKHKRSRSSSGSVIVVDERKERRLHSVVKERRRSLEEEERPARTYYQKEYRSESPIDPERQREVQRFYRGSSKERRFQDQYYEERERNERFEPYQQEGIRNAFNESLPPPTNVYQREQRGLRNPRHEGHGRPGHPEEYQRRPREDNYHAREQQQKGYNNRYNQFEDKGPKRNYHDGREKERRGPPDNNHFREREFPDRREKYPREESFQDRTRDVRRDRPPPREDRPPPPQHRNEPPRSETEEQYRERGRRPEPRTDREPDRRDDKYNKEGKEERYKEAREDRYKEAREDRYKEAREVKYKEEGRDDRYKEGRNGREVREPRRDDRKPERERDGKTESGPRERKSRFADSEGDKEYSWGKTEVKKEGTKDGEKEKPNFGLSGKLTADANTVNGVVIKYTEPDDAKQPKRRWRFYPFKGDKALPILYIHRQSAFLIGRDKKVCDITLEHPSISKQHAALQYRATPFTRPDGTQGRRVRPYVIDLESANGTFVNNKKVESRRYVELLEKDVVKFGFSQREYVLLHENSKDDAQDDDNQDLPTPAIGAAVTTTDKIKQEKRIKEEQAEDGD